MKLGTDKRSYGTTEVTYDVLQLYYWEGDTKAGDVTGDGVEGVSVATVSAVGAAPRASEPVAVPSSGGMYSY